MSEACADLNLLVFGNADSSILAALRGVDGIENRVSIAATADASEDEVERLVSEAFDKYNGFQWAIVSLEPCSLPNQPLETLSLANWEAQLRDQLRWPFILCKALLNEFLFDVEPKSLLLLFPTPPKPEAFASVIDQGLFALIRSISKEYGSRNIRCNGVCYSQTSLDQPLGLQSVIKTAIFLMSPEASFINGEVIHLDDQPQDF